LVAAGRAASNNMSTLCDWVGTCLHPRIMHWQPGGGSSLTVASSLLYPFTAVLLRSPDLNQENQDDEDAAAGAEGWWPEGDAVP
jgi:hypothetical protein